MAYVSQTDKKELAPDNKDVLKNYKMKASINVNNQSTQEVEAAIHIDYSIELEPGHISSYVGRCYKPKGNEQGVSSLKRGISLKATQDVRDIERARLARVINFYASEEGTVDLKEYKLDQIIADSRKKESISIYLRATVISFMSLLFFSLGGGPLLDIMGVNINSFKIIGGLFLIFIAFEMVFEKRDERRQNLADSAIDEASAISLATFPLAIPLIAGPGSITCLLYTSPSPRDS